MSVSCLLLFAGLVAVAEQPSGYDVRLREAVRLLERDGPERALRVVEELVREAPERAQGLYVLGTLYRRLWRPLDAVEAFTRVAELDPERAFEIQREIAVTYAELQAFEPAFEHLDRSLSLRPGHAPTLFAKAMVLSQQGRTDEARRIYESLEEASNENPSLLFRIAELRDSENETETAEAGYRRVLELDPSMQAAHYRLGRLLLASGRAREAERRLARAVALAPEHGESHLELARALDALDRPEKARHHFEQAVRFTPGLPATHLAYGNFLMRHGDRETAASHLDRFQSLKDDETTTRRYLDAIDHDPDDFEKKSELVSFLLEREHYPLALRSAQRFQLSGEDVRHDVLVAVVYDAWGRAGDAGRVLDDAEERYRGNTAALRRLETARETIQP